MMRGSEEMAYAMHVADYNATNVELGRPLQMWDELMEEEQTMYLRHVDAMLHYLFDDGHISSYVSHKTLDEYKAKYKAYLDKKLQERQ